MKIRTTLIVLASVCAAAMLTDANATNCQNGAKDYPTCTPKATKPPPVKTPPPAAQPAPPAPPAPPAAAPAPAATPAPAAAPTPTVVVVPGAAAAPAGPVSLAADLTPSQVATLRQQAAAEADAAGGAGGGGGGGGAGGAITDQSVHKGSYAVGLNIKPAETPAMAAVTCPTPTITQETQFGTIIGSVGRGSSKTDSGDCVVLTVIARMKCRPRTVALAENALLSKHLPGFTPPLVAATVQDSAEDCDKSVASAPPPVPAQPAQPAPPTVQKVSLSADAIFDFDKAVLKPAGRAKLDEIAAKLQGEAANIVVTGHTDSRGSDAYNLSLSMRRANAVRAHLALAGIDLMRMVAIGKGKSEPIADNRSEEGRTLNRRVEVQITVQPVSRKLATLVNSSGE